MHHDESCVVMGSPFPPAGSGRLCQGGHPEFHPPSAGLARRRRRDAAWAGVAGAGVPVATSLECRYTFWRGPKGVKLCGPAGLHQRGPHQRPLGPAL